MNLRSFVDLVHIHGQRPGISWVFGSLMERLIFERGTLTRIGLFAFFGSGFAHIFGVKSKESQGYKFGSVKAFIKRLTCVNQKCLLRSLVMMRLMVKLLEPAWTSGFPWRRFFQSPQIQERNTLKSTFTVYYILTVSININFSFILETKSSSFLGLNG